MSESCVDPRYPATYHVSPQWRVTGDGGLDTVGEESGVRVPLARASLRLLELAGGSLAGAARLKPGKPLTKLAARVEPGGRFYHGPMAVGGGNEGEGEDGFHGELGCHKALSFGPFAASAFFNLDRGFLTR